jgi:predicted O-methyltransferase YrrM
MSDEPRRSDAVAEAVARLESRMDESARATESALKKVRVNQKRLERTIDKIFTRLMKLGAAFDPTVDPRFVEAAAPLIDAGRTMLGYDRLYTLWQAAASAASLPLPVVELGTYRGGSAALLAAAFRALAEEERELHVVDTFTGHLDETLSGHDDTDRQRGKFQDNSAADVRQFLAEYRAVQVHEGDATSVVRTWPERQYALVHLDVDLYRPTLDMLNYFGPRIAPGGILVVDDYEAPTCPGVAEAVARHLSRESGYQRWRLQPEQLVLIKR